MSELVTEARVEAWFEVPQAWKPLGEHAIPVAVEIARAFCAEELRTGIPPIHPVRVIDSAGTVVAQWGRT